MNLKIKFELEETELNGEIENLIPSSSGGLPSGGTTGQVLTKNSNADGDAGWKDTEHDLFNANGKTYEEVIYAYESGKVCYLTYAGTKLLNNGYSGNRNPFKFSGENSNGEILTATLSYDNTLTFGDRGDYQITTASQTLSKEKQSQALANIGGLSKNQGTANSGKFLGIGADGIVVPTEVGGGSSDISFPLLYEATTTEEVRWIDTGANAFRAKRRLIIQLISKATPSNSTDNVGCGSIYTDGSPISSAYANYVLTRGMAAMLPKQYDRLNTFYGYRVNDDASWIFYHTNRTVVNNGSTALNCSNQNSAVSKKDITGFIIGDNSAAANEGTRVFGIGTEIKVWGV